jgi:hypothetical protein
MPLIFSRGSIGYSLSSLGAKYDRGKEKLDHVDERCLHPHGELSDG